MALQTLHVRAACAPMRSEKTRVARAPDDFEPIFVETARASVLTALQKCLKLPQQRSRSAKSMRHNRRNASCLTMKGRNLRAVPASPEKRNAVWNDSVRGDCAPSRQKPARKS